MSTANGKTYISQDTTTGVAGMFVGYDPATDRSKIAVKNSTNQNLPLSILASEIDGLGSLSLRAAPRVYWLSTTGTVSVASGPAVQVVFNTTLNSAPFLTTNYPGILGNVNAGAFTVNETGMYFLTANVRFLYATGGTGGMRQIWFDRNGSAIGVNRMAQGNYSGHLVITTVFFGQFLAGDVIKLYVGQDSGVTLTLDKQNYCPNLGIFRLW